MKKLISSALIICTLSLTTVSVLNSCKSDDDPTITRTIKSQSNITVKNGEKLVWDANADYELTGAVVVENGGEFTIPAGTKVYCSGGTSTYIAVAQGGKIFINGTASDPVVFTSKTQKKADWGGIVLCGKAPINAGATATSEVANLTYGGTVPNDNSGSITYTQIRYAGARFSDTKEYNGLSLFGVGNGTKIDNIAVIDGADDGIEFFGGTVNVSNILSINNDDDAFDWTEGWNGTATNIYGKRTSATVGNRGIEADNNSKTHTATPMSNPTIKNATFIGYTTTDNEQQGMNLFRVGTGATLDNIVFSGWEIAIALQDEATLANLNGKGKFTNIKFDNNTHKAKVVVEVKGEPYTFTDVADGTFTESAAATGAGNGTATPSWASGWSGL